MFSPMFRKRLGSASLAIVMFGSSSSKAIDLSLLMQAISKENSNLVLQLLQQYSLEEGKADQPTSQDSTTEYLRSNGLDQVAIAPAIAQRNYYGYQTVHCTPLQLAAGFSTPKIVDLLTTHGADPNYADKHHAGNTPLKYACRFGRVENARVLLASGAEPNHCPFTGWGMNFPIHEAVKGGNIDVVELILSATNRAVNAKNRFRTTPLHCACRQPEIFDLLVQHGADINAVDQDGRTVLYASLCNGEPAVTAKIMRSKNFNWQSIHRRIEHSLSVWTTPTRLPGSYSMTQCSYRKGDTLFHACARNRSNHLEAVMILLACGLDPQSINCDNETAVTIAEREGNHALCDLLESAIIANVNTAMERYTPSSAEPLSLQLWSAYAIRRDIRLWDIAAQLLPRHMVTFVFGGKWLFFKPSAVRAKAFNLSTH